MRLRIQRCGLTLKVYKWKDELRSLPKLAYGEIKVSERSDVNSPMLFRAHERSIARAAGDEAVTNSARE